MFLLIASNVLASSSNWDSLYIPADAVFFKITNDTDYKITVYYDIQQGPRLRTLCAMNLLPNETQALQGIRLRELFTKDKRYENWLERPFSENEAQFDSYRVCSGPNGRLEISDAPGAEIVVSTIHQ
jgi:hypothetical protein